VQVVYSDVYMLDDEMTWKQLPPMPKPDSHIEFAWVNVNNSLIIAGGTTEKHPITKKMVLVGEVFRFNWETLVQIGPFVSFVFPFLYRQFEKTWEIRVRKHKQHIYFLILIIFLLYFKIIKCHVNNVLLCIIE
jgi:hypothetical protein